MKNIIAIMLFGLISACGGGNNQETIMIEQQIQKINYTFLIKKDFKTDSWQMYKVVLNDDSTYICLKINWVNEYGLNDSKQFFNGEKDLIIYFPFSDLRYEVFNYNTKEILEKGIIDAD
jgi:hypothetical protein